MAHTSPVRVMDTQFGVLCADRDARRQGIQRRTLSILRVRGLSRGGGTWAGPAKGELEKAYQGEGTAHAGSTGHLAAATESRMP